MSNPVPVDRAKVSIPQPTTAEAMVTEGNTLAVAVNNSANINAATGVAAAIKDFSGVNTALDTNNKAKAKAMADLHTAETSEPPLVRRWGTKRRALSTAIEDFADGSKEIVLSFGVALEEKTPQPDAITPENLRPMKVKKHTMAGCRWDPTPGAHGYMIQHATNPADPTTYSATISLSRSRFWLAGQTPGATIYFRVLACDADLPNGQSAFTAWVAVLAT